jgi:hypothetical protein
MTRALAISTRRLEQLWLQRGFEVRRRKRRRYRFVGDDMCDLLRERKRIDRLLACAANQEAVGESTDKARLAQFALAVMREHYDEACPDACMRKRCEDFAATVTQRRVEKVQRR